VLSSNLLDHRLGHIVQHEHPGVDALLPLEVGQVSSCGVSPLATWSDTVDQCFPNFREAPREVPLGFFLITRSSAAVKAAAPFDALVDVLLDGAV